METQELSLDDRIANLQAIISVVEYEIALLLKQKEHHPIGFIVGQGDKGQTRKKK